MLASDWYILKGGGGVGILTLAGVAFVDFQVQSLTHKHTIQVATKGII